MSQTTPHIAKTTTSGPDRPCHPGAAVPAVSETLERPRPTWMPGHPASATSTSSASTTTSTPATRPGMVPAAPALIDTVITNVLEYAPELLVIVFALLVSLLPGYGLVAVLAIPAAVMVTWQDTRRRVRNARARNAHQAALAVRHV